MSHSNCLLTFYNCHSFSYGKGTISIISSSLLSSVQPQGVRHQQRVLVCYLFCITGQGQCEHKSCKDIVLFSLEELGHSMAFLELLYVACYPVIKILILTALGSFLALDRINLLGEDARKYLNDVVFYVFNPALVGVYLAETITFRIFISLWFMTVNILLTFILGTALGWIVIKITRPPKQLKGLILGCCSAGNLGYMLIIIIPAICEVKGSPFGDSDVCYEKGMSYASLSMAISAVFVWSYVFNLIWISSRDFGEEADTGYDGGLESAGENSGSLPGERSEAQNVDVGYTVLLPDNESEEKTKASISDNIKHWLQSNINLEAIFAPSTLGAIVGFIVGMVSPIRKLLIGSDAPLYVIEDCAVTLGDAAVPTIILIVGANLLKGLRRTGNLFWSLVGIVVVRYVCLPLLGLAVVKGATHFGWVNTDSLYLYVLLLQYALPPAMNIGTMAQLYGAGESECSVIMLWTNALAIIAVSLWSTYYMWLVT